MSTFTSSGGQQSITLSGVTSPEVNNVDLATANTEYSIVFPSNTQKYLLKLRDTTVELKLRFVSGGDYLTVPRGCSFTEDGITAASLTLYVEAGEASQVLEIVSWS